MKAQKRSKNRKSYGEAKYHGDKLSLRSAQSKGQITSNKNKKLIGDKNNISHQLSEFYVPEIILPKFSILATNINTSNLLSIDNADIGYLPNTLILNMVLDVIKHMHCNIFLQPWQCIIFYKIGYSNSNCHEGIYSTAY